MMPKKPKSPQAENPTEVSGRDTFQTPNYATDIIVPYLLARKFFGARFRIWECASGKGKIVNRLTEKGLDVFGTDLQDEIPVNFLGDNHFEFDCIVTNPPFSLKRKFYEKCLEYEVPFALLIPADYSGWIIKATQDGAEKIIPTRRIDYITPAGLFGGNGSVAKFHSMWLTKGFGIGKSETFVELTNEQKTANI